MKLVSTNPAKNYEVLGEVKVSTDSEIKEKVEMANKARLAWKELGIKERIRLLEKIYEEFKLKKEEFAGLITKETGKTIGDSKAEADTSLTDFRWFLDNAEKALEDEITFKDNNFINKIVYEPIGTVAVITPWNFPLKMFIWGAVPNLIAGNTVVFKISEECPLIGRLIEQAMNINPLPEGVFSEVYGNGAIGQKLAESDVDLIWFTGSTKTGQLLYKIAANKFIKAIMEMGGSNPTIVFDDVNISKIIPELYNQRFTCCGQKCGALKRLIVHESIFDEVVSKLEATIGKKIVGNPENEKTDIGSLVARRQLVLLQEQVKDAVEKGAKIIIGGKVPETLQGAFYEPIILTNITRDMRVWKEEVFGPVLPIVKFKTEEEAIELANDTMYGLGAKVFSRDIERAERVASKIQAGTVEINNSSRIIPYSPFGGYKHSGIGREHGMMGFRELCQVKVVSE